jgi:TfoX N-terminal domain
MPGDPDQDGLTMPYDEELAARIRQILAGEPALSEKKMFGGLAFLIGGNMAVTASGHGGLMVRVDPAQSDTLVSTTPARVLSLISSPHFLSPGRFCELHVDGETCTIAAAGQGVTVEAGADPRAQATVGIAKEDLTSLMTARRTANAVRARVKVDGDQTAATELLTLLEGALAPGTTTGTAASLANLPDSVAPAQVPTASPAPSSGEHRGCTLPGENHDPE